MAAYADTDGTIEMSRDDEFSGEPLTEAENKTIRRLIRDEDRGRFFWRTMILWGKYLGGGLIFFGGLWEFVIKHLKVLP